MIRTILAASIVLGATLDGALAAELPANVELPANAELVPEEPPPMPVFSWTGGYVGLHAGYDIGHDGIGLRTRLGGGAYGADPNGIVGGLHIGYNRALPGIGPHALVVGVEGDVDGADYKRTQRLPGGGLGGSNETVRSDVKGSLRARAGVAGGRVLYYATGGAAFANFDTRYNGTAMFGPGAVETYQRTQAGYTLGGGVEYAFLNYVSVRAEYRFTDYGAFTDQLGGAAPGLAAGATHRDTDSRLQAGVSYKFD